jgi:hypothetical protein
MAEALKTDTAWRSFLLVNLILTGVVFVFSLLAIIRYRDELGSRLAVSGIRPSSLRAKLTTTLVASIMRGGATVCLELALFYGPVRSWGSTSVLGLLVGGFVGCSVVSYAIQYLASRWSEHTPDLRLRLRIFLQLVFFVLWGASYFSLSHYLRKFLNLFTR